MNTTNLLSIKPDSTDIITGQALAMVSSSNKKTELFKSAFNDQMSNKRNEQTRSDKNLPQNGNELPKKKIAVINKERSQQSNNDEPLTKTKNENAIAAKDAEQAEQRKLNKSHEEKSSHEQANKTGQKNNTGEVNGTEQVDNPEQTNSPASLTTLEQGNSAEQLISINSENSENEAVPGAIPQQPGSEEGLETSYSGEQSASELIVSTESNSSADKHPIYAASDSLSTDKKIQSEMTRTQFDLNQTASNSNIISDSAAKAGMSSGSENKNESALTKSIADFQQFIEMSKKHSMAGEPIASVKSFEQSIKTEQLNTQVLLTDNKLPAGQISAQSSVQSTLLDRVNTSLTNPLSQTTSSMEVKTAVGKAGWNQNFSNQIVMMVNNGVQQAKIKLNPMSLGPVEAMVKLSGETAVVNLTSLHLTTKDAMENAIPRLKEMLNENGFSQVDVNVSHQDNKEQQEAALDAKTGSNNEHGNSTMPGDEQLSDETLDSETGTQVSGLDEQGLNIVDYYA